MERNEEADKAANETREDDQKVEIDWKVYKTAIERGLKQKVQRDERCSIICSSKIKRKYHDRMGNIIMAQLRSGHCPKTKYYEKKIEKAIDARCDDWGGGGRQRLYMGMYKTGKRAQKVRNEWSGNTEGGGSFSEVSLKNQERLVYIRRAVTSAHTHDLGIFPTLILIYKMVSTGQPTCLYQVRRTVTEST